MLSARGRWLVVLGFACFFIWALFPFDWDPPKKLQNGGRILSDGTLSFQEAGIVTKRGPHPWFSVAQEADEFTLSLKVRSLRPEQDGPARILTFALDHYLRNITVAQDGESLVIIVYTETGSESLEPRYVVPHLFGSDEWQEVIIRISSSRIQVELYGDTIYDKPIQADRVIESWRSSYALSIGNELTGLRPWLGEIAEARILVGSTSFDLLASDEIVLRPTFWVGRYAPRFVSMFTTDLSSELWMDYAANFWCFIPLGFIVALRRPHFYPILRATVLCGVGSLGVEIVQIFFDQCFPSVYDWLLNTLGATAGGMLAVLYRKKSLKSGHGLGM